LKKNSSTSKVEKKLFYSDPCLKNMEKSKIFQMEGKKIGQRNFYLLYNKKSIEKSFLG